MGQDMGGQEGAEIGRLRGLREGGQRSCRWQAGLANSSQGLDDGGDRLDRLGQRGAGWSRVGRQGGAKGWAVVAVEVLMTAEHGAKCCSRPFVKPPLVDALGSVNPAHVCVCLAAVCNEQWVSGGDECEPGGPGYTNCQVG